MRIIEVTPLPNGGHQNQTGYFETIPDGWAVIPDRMKMPNFPFGTVTTTEIDGVMTITAWTAETSPEPTPTPAPTETEKLRADVDYIAIMTNVDLGEV